MKIINQLERFPRGVYTGAIGFLKPGGDCIFNVAIRTLQLESKTGVVTFGVGGGVTADSTAEREYSECLVKSAFLEARATEFQLLESILLDEGNYFLLERHLARIRDSAAFFDFRYPEQEIISNLERLAVEYPHERWKVRVLLAKDGEIQTEIRKVELQSRIRRVALAPEMVNSSDRMLFHKTTDRSAFGSSLTAGDYDDVIFLNERGEVTESTNANVVVRIEDQLWTPPVECGLLRGTFRAQLIAEGQISERVITVEELLSSTEVFLINSVQKWMPAIFGNGQTPPSTAGKLQS